MVFTSQRGGEDGGRGSTLAGTSIPEKVEARRRGRRGVEGKVGGGGGLKGAGQGEGCRG